MGLGHSKSRRAVIISGEDYDLSLKITSKLTKDGFDLSNASGIEACFLQADGSLLTKDLTNGITITNPTCGKMVVSLTNSDTGLLKQGLRLDFDVKITIGSIIKKVAFIGELDIHCSIC